MPLAFIAATPLVSHPARPFLRPSKCPLRALSARASGPTPPATPSPSVVPQQASALESPMIPDTPCFTPRIMSTPMPPDHRKVYLHAAALATASYLSDLKQSPKSPVARITLLPPQLNPELDVYDRRFLLQLVWAVIDVTAASCSLRTRVLIQGTGAFGAVPLSIAGLKRTFDADLQLSKDAWPENAIRSGFLEEHADLDDDDDIVIVVSPTNAVSIPVIESLVEMVQRAKGKPILLINPRLSDVPSHSGVMQVAGRKERLAFLENVEDIFYLRLLFKAGTNYPLRGILYRSHPGDWQVWCTDDADITYRLIKSSPTRPPSEKIGDAFSVDKYRQQKRLVQESQEGSVMSIEQIIASPASLAIIAIIMVAVALKFVGGDAVPLLQKFSTVPQP